MLTDAELNSNDWEPVFTISEFYDGPRSGIANFRAVPHRFEPEWDRNAVRFTQVFYLMPIDRRVFEIELEIWKIRLRWANNPALRNAGSFDMVLPQDKDRLKQLTDLIGKPFDVDIDKAIRARGVFRETLDPDREYDVLWTEVTMPSQHLLP